MPKPTRRVPDDPGRPSPREAISKATAAAGPRVARAVEKATPKVEKAAVSAGKLLGTLRDRARETAKEFTDAYQGSDDQPGETEPTVKRRPRPRPTKD